MPGEPATTPRRCGPYAVRLVPGEIQQGGGSLRLIDSRGRVAHTIREHVVGVVACEDLTADGRPELIVSTYSGGAHCCTTFHVLSLGRRVRTLLHWDAGNAHALEPADLVAATPALELVGQDMRLAYFDDLPYAASPSLPVVFCYEGGAYRECTRRIRSLILAERGAAQEALKAETHLPSRKGEGLRALALSLMVDEEDAAWRWLGDSLPMWSPGSGNTEIRWPPA